MTSNTAVPPARKPIPTKALSYLTGADQRNEPDPSN